MTLAPPVHVRLRVKIATLTGIAIVSALLIAGPVALGGTLATGVSGTAVGAAATGLIICAAYANRCRRTTTRWGLPVWGIAIGSIAVCATIGFSDLGVVDGAFISSFVGGLFFAYGVVLVVVPRRFYADPLG